MKKLIELSIQYRILVVTSFVFIGFVSIFSVRTSNIDFIPDIGENQQIVFTDWPGRSPKDIDEQITYPLSILLQGIPGVKTVRGISVFGFSTIYVIFKEEVDFYWSRSRIIEKLIESQSDLPPEVKPRLGPDATGLGQVFWYTIENDESVSGASLKSLAQLRSLQDFYVKYHLQNVEGVSEVASVGGFVKEYQIDVDPKKLFAFDVHFSTLVKAIQNSNIDVGAEVIEDGSREFIIRGKGFFESLTDIENVVIAVKNKTPVYVKDVASVGLGPAFRRGVLDKNGLETVGGVVTMRFGENPQQVIQNIKERIKDVQRGLPKGVRLVPFYDRTELIENTMSTVYKALIQEIIVAIVLVFIFLLHLWCGILVSLTLPFAIGISFIFMRLFGIDSNVMSLSGIVIAIGTIVDMGIIMTEAIYSRLMASSYMSLKEKVRIVKTCAQEISPAIFTSIMTTIVTFLPILALEGSEGQLFWPLAWAKTFALLGSLIVAVFLIPSLSIFLLKDKVFSFRENLSIKTKMSRKNKIDVFIVQKYRFMLDWVLGHRRLFLIAPAFLIVMGFIAFMNLGEEFMPELNEGDILYMPVTTSDVSLTKAKEILSYTDKVLNEHPLVDFAVGKLGRADSVLDPAPISMIETVIRLVPSSQWPRGKDIYDIMEDLDKALQIPGLVNSWGFPIQTRIGMISTGIKTQVGIKVFGDDIAVLEDLTSQIAQKIEKMDSAYGVYKEQIIGKPYIEFDIDQISASQFGINIGTIHEILQTAVGGMPIGQFYEGRERYSIRVRYKKELRDRIDELKRILVPSPLDQHIPLEQLADIKVVTGPSHIVSENGILRSTVLFNVRDRDLIGFVQRAKVIIEKEIDLPEKYSVVWAGEYENHVRANNRLKLILPLIFMISLIILFLGTGSFVNSLIIFSAVPISMTGGLILLWLGGFHLSVAVWVGFIALFGIAVDDGILMITYFKQEMKDNKPANFEHLKSVILEAGSRRIRPLLMTTATTSLALLPVMWSTSIGSEVMKPMALPTLGGMLIEVITLFVVPVLFSFVEERKLHN